MVIAVVVVLVEMVIIEIVAGIAAAGYILYYRKDSLKKNEEHEC